MDTSANSAPDGAFPPLRKALPIFLMLCLAGVVAYLDRQIINLLLDPIRQDLNITDTEVSLLQGAAFGIFYAAFGLPIGFLVDRFDRKMLIVVGMLVWSIATALCGLSTTFWQLFVFRAIVAIGEATLHPAAYSMVTDLFRPDRRGKAFTMLSMASNCGIAASFLAGGLILHMISSIKLESLPFVPDPSSWHLAFLFASVPGLILAPLILFIPKVKRLEVAAKAGIEASRITLIGFAKRNLRFFISIFAMYGFVSSGVLGMLAWMAVAYIRGKGLPPSDVGYIMGILFLVGSLIGGPLMGWAADALLKRGRLNGKMLILTVCASLAAIGHVLWWSTANIPLSLVIGTFVFIMQIGVMSLAPAALNELVPNELRGRMSAAYLVLMSVIGISVGPVAIALITDHVFKDPAMVGYSIMAFSAPCLLIAALIAWLIRKEYTAVMLKGANA